MARTSDPHAATLKAWLTRARSGDGSGGATQSRGDFGKEEAQLRQLRGSFKDRYQLQDEEMKRLGPFDTATDSGRKAFNAAYKKAEAWADRRLREENDEIIAIETKVRTGKARLAVDKALRAKVGGVTIEGSEEDRRLIAKMLPNAEAGDLRTLAMALPGSEVRVRIRPPGGRPTVIELMGKGGGLLSSQREISVRADGALVMENVGVELDESLKGVGLGTVLFAEQVAAAKRVGIRAITAKCARALDLNGYYTWARMGFDGTGTLARKKKVRISEQMKTKAGRNEWRWDGDTFNGTFSLKAGSYSMRTLSAYLERE